MMAFTIKFNFRRNFHAQYFDWKFLQMSLGSKLPNIKILCENNGILFQNFCQNIKHPGNHLLIESEHIVWLAIFKKRGKAKKTHIFFRNTVQDRDIRFVHTSLQQLPFTIAIMALFFFTATIDKLHCVIKKSENWQWTCTPAVFSERTYFSYCYASFINPGACIKQMIILKDMPMKKTHTYTARERLCVSIYVGSKHSIARRLCTSNDKYSYIFFLLLFHMSRKKAISILK